MTRQQQPNGASHPAAESAALNPLGTSASPPAGAQPHTIRGPLPAQTPPARVGRHLGTASAAAPWSALPLGMKLMLQILALSMMGSHHRGKTHAQKARPTRNRQSPANHGRHCRRTGPPHWPPREFRRVAWSARVAEHPKSTPWERRVSRAPRPARTRPPRGWARVWARLPRPSRARASIWAHCSVWQVLHTS